MTVLVAKSDSRLREYRIPENELLLVAKRKVYPCWSLVVPELEQDLPEGATVRNVYYNPSCRALSVVVEHESFDEVGDGDVLPVAGELLSISRRVYILIGEHQAVDLSRFRNSELVQLKMLVNKELSDRGSKDDD